MDTIRILALIGLVLFYGTFIGKALLLKRQNISVNQLGKGKHGLSFYQDITLLISQYLIAGVMAVSVLCSEPVLSKPWMIVGLTAEYLAVIIFFRAIWDMKDSWRAGTPQDEKTHLVTTGIYRISRNPAFLAFDMLFFAILMMYFNWPLLILCLAVILLLHLQILSEEKFLKDTFGSKYLEYKRSVYRYCNLP